MLAVDLEADSMFHYQEKVCLLQMAGNGENVVIDPLEVKICRLGPYSRQECLQGASRIGLRCPLPLPGFFHRDR
jgi:hypothetical protein